MEGSPRVRQALALWLTLFVVVALCVRLAGVFACGSHIFQLSSMSCL